MRVGATSDAEYDRILSEGGDRAEIYRRLRALRDTYADRIRSRFPNIPRRVSGYGLEELLPEHAFNVARALVGTEDTWPHLPDVNLRRQTGKPLGGEQTGQA